jgi:competence protein ComEC
MPTSFLLLTSVSFVLGIIFGEIFDPDLGVLITLSIVSGILLIVSSRNTPRFLFFSVLVCFCLSFGAIRYEMSIETVHPLDGYLNQAVSGVGVISDEPVQKEHALQLQIMIESIDGTSINTKPSLLFITETYGAFQYGDRVHFSGTVETPTNFVTDGKTFDYQSYLAKDGIYALIRYGELTVVEHHQGSMLIDLLFGIKSRLKAGIDAVLPIPESTLLGGLLLGGKNVLPQDLQDLFRNAGVIHIIVLSGYNFMILVSMFGVLFTRVPLYAKTVLLLVVLVLFAIMVGGGATVIRALLMACILLLARATKRPYDALRALLIAGVVMLMHNPKILLHDLSFELSFLASIGLLLVAPLVTSWFRFLPERFGLQELAVSTTATQITVLPLLLYTTGSISVLSVGTNVLILPCIPVTMLFGFLAALVALISPLLAFPFSFTSHALLSYILLVVQSIGSLPFASVTINFFPLWLMIAAYGVLFFWWYKKTPAVRP